MADGISYIVTESISKFLNVIENKNFKEINNIFNEIITCFLNINFDNNSEKQKFSKLLILLIKWWDCLSFKICCDDSYIITNDDISNGKKILFDIKKYITISSWQVSIEEKDEDDTNCDKVITDMIVYSLPMLEKTPNSDEFCSLMKNLMNRQIDMFKPNFNIPETESDGDDNESKCEEESETRKEQHGSKTTEEEITKTPDGREIRSTKTRIVNSSRTSKNITVRTFGNGQDNIRKNFFDVTRSHNEDSDEEFSESFKKPSFKNRNTFTDNTNSFFNDKKLLTFGDFKNDESLLSNRLSTLNDSIYDNSKKYDNNEELQNNELQKIKKVDHSSATLQVVEKTKKTNGKLMFNAAAHKLDTKQLSAQQTEIYDDNELLRKEGDGCFEENTTIGTGDVNPEALINLGTVNRFGLHNSKEFECGNYDNNGSYIKGLTMTSYLLVNESISNHEEQFRKRLQFEFRNNSPLKIEENKDIDNKIDLNQLLELSDFNEMSKEVAKNISDLSKYEESDKINKKILSLSEDLSLFEIIDVKDYLVFVTKSDSNGKISKICRGGPKNALIVYATQNNASLLYKEAFISTYRTFISSLDVIRYLLYRFQYMINQFTNKDNSYAHSTVSVIIRIIQNLSITEISEEILCTINDLYKILYDNCEIQFLKILRKLISTNIMTFYESKINNILPKQVHCMLDEYRVKEFLNLRSMKLAQEITIISSKLFHNVKELELLWWSIDQSNLHSTNLKRLTNNFNFISYWCRSLILMSNEQKIREKIFIKFLKIAKYLKQFGDLNSYLAIIAALDSGPVNRLQWNKTINDGMKEHRIIMSSSYSFKNYRQLFSQCKPPCIPYIGLILQDLTFIYNGAVQKLSDKEYNGINYINFVKCFKQFTILESVRKLKMWDYSFETDEVYKNFLNNFVEHYSEEECWIRSEMIKPRHLKN
ncbi:Rap guanine nucleotide exchange factor 1 [Strongyloides ratti]|uniref:Rap guanine nucleotide exchange factor 1 n=1 Tax=Strongyloides ratti TaxID=34506 RepID=A0A090KPQ8_STRRB|nr:Rap guanine nucleotide exchange factor 1 [Strongyloides ratti]CEF59369.1 Rap guanine nucleotide exchange factor 1 [Strongyloides ratti]